MTTKWNKNVNNCVFPALIQEKLNGVAAKLEGGLFYSKNNLLFEGLVGPLLKGETVLGELYVPGRALQDIVHLVRAASPEVRFYVHWFPSRSFRENLDYFLHHDDKKFPLKVRTDVVHNLSEALAHEFARTGEGAVLKDYLGQWFKLKRFFEEEFVCVSAQVRKSLSLTLKAENGEQFKCGSFEFDSSFVRELCEHPPIGKQVTVRFLEHTNRGVPRHATVIAIRDYE